MDQVEAVVMSLEYLRHNIAQAVLAHHYRVAQSTVSRLIRRITPILARRLEDFDLDEDLPATALLVDGTLITPATAPDDRSCVPVTVTDPG